MDADTENNKKIPDILEFLIDAKADINACWKWNLENNDQLMRFLYNNSNFFGRIVHFQNLVDCEAFPLLISCMHIDIEITNFLIDMKANVNQATLKNGITPLQLAINNKIDQTSDMSKRDPTRFMLLLIESKANVNQARTDDGTNPLHIAADESNAEVMRLLIESKADINQTKNVNEVTAWSVSAKKRYLSAIEVLLDFKVDINRQSTDSPKPNSILLDCRRL